MLPSETVIGKTAFDGFKAETESEYKLKVKIFKNFLRQIFPRLSLELIEDDTGVIHVQISNDERCVIFPVYNGYIELGGINYSFDSDGCLNVINALTYYLQVPAVNMSNRFLSIVL